MDATAAIKKAPRWAWYTAGGVGVGVGAIHLWKNRTTSDGSTPLPDSTVDTSATDMGGTPATVGGGSPGTILIPSIATTENGGGDATSGVSAGVGAFGGIVDSFGGVLAPFLDNNSGTINSLVGTVDDALTGLIANAGSAPAPLAQNPTPLPGTVPVAGTGKQGGKAKPTCGGEFPHMNPHTNKCYKIVCSKGKKGELKPSGEWHVYKDGKKVHSGSKC